MKQLFFGKVVDGKLKLTRRTEFQELLNLYEGKEIEVSVDKKRNTRSVSQNSYLWGVVIPVVQDGLKGMGMKATKEETHELLKMKFLQKELVNELTGEIMRYVGSTTELSKSEFMDYISEIQQFCSEFLNVYLPSPNEE